MSPVLLRFAAAGARSPESVQRLLALGTSIDRAAVGALLQQPGAPVRPRLLLSGWAYHCRHFSDGRRPIIDVVLPGDPFWAGPYPDDAGVALVAHTPVTMVAARNLFDSTTRQACPDLDTALDALARAEQQRRLDYIVRLGCLTARERLVHFLLEMNDRLAVIGQANDGVFSFPFTQDLLGAVLGLSTVHVNRTLQDLRNMGLAEIKRGSVRLGDRAGLEQLANYEARLF